LKGRKFDNSNNFSPQNNGRQNPAPLKNAVWIFNNEEQLDLVDSQRPISLLDSQMDKIHEVNKFMQRKLCLMNNHEPGFEEFFIPGFKKISNLIQNFFKSQCFRRAAT
jgi:hypothetical protein